MAAPRNKTELLASLPGDTPPFVFFLDPRAAPDRQPGPAVLSQWWPCRFTFDHRRFHTAEHAMMYAKAQLFGDHATAARIASTWHPFEAKALGRSVRGFYETRWQAERVPIVIAINREKFFQNPVLNAYLQSTGRAVLAEASPTDLIWGTGIAATDSRATTPAAWPGESRLGFALMQVRELLAPSPAIPAATA
ncbi:MAG: NADAR family protein [Opitutaceae bacterium]|nr:NADAR family protein [Opitutaceae bacterium]